MQIPHCPRCSYALIFLESRLRYKCSICGISYLQRETEHRSFRQWNVQQRELDRAKKRKSWKLSEFQKENLKDRRKLRGLRYLFKESRKKLSDEEKRAKNAMHTRVWKEKNPEKQREVERRYYLKHKEQRKAYQKEWTAKNHEEAKFKQRISHWRRKQLELARENANNKDYTDSFTTFCLSDLLLKGQIFNIIHKLICKRNICFRVI